MQETRLIFSKITELSNNFQKRSSRFVQIFESKIIQDFFQTPSKTTISFSQGYQ